MNLFPKIQESTIKTIKENKTIIFALFVLNIASSLQIPILSFVLGLSLTIILYSMITYIHNEKTYNDIDFLKYYQTGIGIYLGNLIITISTVFIFIILELILMWISGYFSSLTQLKGIDVENNIGYTLSIIFNPRLIIPLLGFLLYGIFMYLYPYYISKAMRENGISKSLETVLSVFNIQKNKEIFYNYEYFIYTLKYLGIALLIFISIILPIILIYISTSMTINDVFNIEDGIKYSLFFIISILYSLTIGFLFTIYSYFFIYYIKEVIDK